jgi:ribose transport system substrate-binding protein
MRFPKLLLLGALVLVAAILISACAPMPAPQTAVEPAKVEEEAAPAPTVEAETEAAAESAAAEKELYFVYVPKLVHPWYEDVKKGMEQAIAELAQQGINIKYEWDAPPEGDVVQWTQRLEAAIAKKPDVLAVSCLDADAGKPLIEEAVAQGIPVVGFDTPCPGSPLTTFVGHEVYTQDGADMANILAEALGGKGKVAILMGSPGAANHKQRVEGFKQTMAEKYPDIEIVAEEYDNDDLERAVNLTASILQAHPDLNGIFGANATAPIGAGQAIVEAGKKGEVILVGMDDLPEMVGFVKDGTALAMSLQHVPEIGYWSIKYMTALAQGRTVPPVHDTGSFVVDQSMVDTYKAQ